MKMGKLFWFLCAVSLYFFISAYLVSSGYSSSKRYNTDEAIAFDCAISGMNEYMSLNDSLSECRHIMKEHGFFVSKSGSGRVLAISAIGFLFAGFAIWRASVVIKSRKSNI